jgi:hypothetical protein
MLIDNTLTSHKRIITLNENVFKGLSGNTFLEAEMENFIFRESFNWSTLTVENELQI